MKDSGFVNVRRIPTLASEVGRRLREETQEPEGFAKFLEGQREKLEPAWQALLEAGAPARDREAFYGISAAVLWGGADTRTRERLVQRFASELSTETLRLLVRERQALNEEARLHSWG